MRGENMNIIDIKTEDLIPYEKNPRRNDKAVKYVAKSIEVFGFKVPLVIDKNNVVICGHTRLKAAKKLGIDKALLGKVYESPEITGYVTEAVAEKCGLAAGTPVVGGAGDNAA